MNNILSGPIISAITTPSPLSAAQIISTETAADKARRFEAQGNPDGTRSLTE